MSPELERLVLETMNRILYNEMGFRGNKDRYYDENNSFIEKVCLTSQVIFFTCDLWSIFCQRMSAFMGPGKKWKNKDSSQL